MTSPRKKAWQTNTPRKSEGGGGKRLERNHKHDTSSEPARSREHHDERAEFINKKRRRESFFVLFLPHCQIRKHATTTRTDKTKTRTFSSFFPSPLTFIRHNPLRTQQRTRQGKRSTKRQNTMKTREKSAKKRRKREKKENRTRFTHDVSSSSNLSQILTPAASSCSSGSSC